MLDGSVERSTFPSPLDPRGPRTQRVRAQDGESNGTTQGVPSESPENMYNLFLPKDIRDLRAEQKRALLSLGTQQEIRKKWQERHESVIKFHNLELSRIIISLLEGG